jgi:hypothetical protein
MPRLSYIEKMKRINNPEKYKVHKTKEDNPFYKKHHLEVTKNIISNKLKAKWADPKYRAKMVNRKGFTGHRHSTESLAKLRQAHLDLCRLGDKAPGWRGGLTLQPYCISFNYRLRTKIRVRDNYTCQLCYCKQCGRKLSIHHIDYDKMNIEQTNLITLCLPCHTKTNFNREYWVKYFNNIIERFYETSNTD